MLRIWPWNISSASSPLRRRPSPLRNSAPRVEQPRGQAAIGFLLAHLHLHALALGVCHIHRGTTRRPRRVSPWRSTGLRAVAARDRYRETRGRPRTTRRGKEGRKEIWTREGTHRHQSTSVYTGRDSKAVCFECFPLGCSRAAVSDGRVVLQKAA